MRQGFDPRLELHRLGQQARDDHQLIDQLLLRVVVDHAARAAQRHGQRREHGQLAGEGLGRGDADFRPREGRGGDVAFARDGRGRHIDDADDLLAMGLGVAQAGQRVRRLARLRHHDHQPLLRQRRLAIAEFRGDVDFDRQAGEALEPVFGDHPGIIGGAAGGQMVMPVRLLPSTGQFEGQPHRGRGKVDVMGECARHNFRLLMDFLGHEMAVIALVDQEGRSLRLDLGARDRLVGLVAEFRRAAAQDHPVAVLEIGDGVGEGRERQGVGAEIHFPALAIADRQGRAAPRADQQVLLDCRK